MIETHHPKCLRVVQGLDPKAPCICEKGHVDGPPENCPVGECMICAVTWCPNQEPLHFHHDGCPACYLAEKKKIQAKDIDEDELLAYIKARKAAKFETPNPVEAWVTKGFPEKVVYAKLVKLEARGLIEYGVSIRQCWLTPVGEIRMKNK